MDTPGCFLRFSHGDTFKTSWWPSWTQAHPVKRYTLLKEFDSKGGFLFWEDPIFRRKTKQIWPRCLLCIYLSYVNIHMIILSELVVTITKRGLTKVRVQTDKRKRGFFFFFFFFVLKFYGPVNPMGSCRARSVYLTTRLLGRLSPLSG